jgi:hypothetical protein
MARIEQLETERNTLNKQVQSLTNQLAQEQLERQKFVSFFFLFLASLISIPRLSFFCILVENVRC